MPCAASAVRASRRTRRWSRWQSILTPYEGHLLRCLLASVVALSSLLVVGAPGVGAQEGTPTAGLDIPTPAECTVAPRSEEDLRVLFREVAATPVLDSPEASPTPAVLPTGGPADEQTVAEINATWRQYLACLSS